jgi:hypothetical protein
MSDMKETVDLIVSGTVYVDGNLVEESSLVIHRGMVVGIVDSSKLPAFKKHLDMKGAWVLPGIVDAHVHCWSNPKEGFLRTTEAAAANSSLKTQPKSFISIPGREVFFRGLTRMWSSLTRRSDGEWRVNRCTLSQSGCLLKTEGLKEK